MLDNQIKKQFGTWTAFCAKHGHDHKNFKRKLLANIDKINIWLDPLGIELQMVLKKPKCGGKNKYCT